MIKKRMLGAFGVGKNIKKHCLLANYPSTIVSIHKTRVVEKKDYKIFSFTVSYELSSRNLFCQMGLLICLESS